MAKKTVRDVDNWQGKRALVRVDFNVPQDEQGRITDDMRIQSSLCTIRHLSDQGARVILMSHLGRPKGNTYHERAQEKYSLAPVAQRLQDLMPDRRIKFSRGEIGALGPELQHMAPGDILLLENIRFYPEEEKNDEAFARRLAALGDIYVNDAFGTAHRAHASTEGVARHMPVKVAGFLMDKEITALTEALSATGGLTAIIGGSKVSTKITVLENLLPRVSNLIIGGAMMFTFLRSQGLLTGSSLVEEDYIGTARELLERASEKGVSLLIPPDVLVADRFHPGAETRTVAVDAIPDDWMGLDIGDASITIIQDLLTSSDVILWNGPVGVFEIPKFAEGTKAIAATLAELTEQGKAKTIIGGGDTVAALEQYGFRHDQFTHVSTGGGASLEFLEGRTLPGIAVLDEAAVGSRA